MNSTACMLASNQATPRFYLAVEKKIKFTSMEQSASSAALRMMGAWSLDIRWHRSAIFRIYLMTLEDIFNYNCVCSIPKITLHVLKTYINI